MICELPLSTPELPHYAVSSQIKVNNVQSCQDAAFCRHKQAKMNKHELLWSGFQAAGITKIHFAKIKTIFNLEKKQKTMQGKIKLKGTHSNC